MQVSGDARWEAKIVSEGVETGWGDRVGFGHPRSGPRVLGGCSYEVCVSELCVLPFRGVKVAAVIEECSRRRTSGVETTPRPQPAHGGFLVDLPCVGACWLGVSAILDSLWSTPSHF